MPPLTRTRTYTGERKGLGPYCTSALLVTFLSQPVICEFVILSGHIAQFYMLHNYNNINTKQTKLMEIECTKWRSQDLQSPLTLNHKRGHHKNYFLSFTEVNFILFAIILFCKNGNKVIYSLIFQNTIKHYSLSKMSTRRQMERKTVPSQPLRSLL